MGIVSGLRQGEIARSSAIERASQRAFFGVAALLVVISAIATIRRCTGMSMGELPMPGGWTLSMTWMRMCGQTWTDVTAAFLAMWVVMMVAMMLPSLTPTLWRYYQAMSRTTGKPQHVRRVQLTMIVGLGYFMVWMLLGAAVFPIGVVLATMAMRSSALASSVPMVAGVIVLSGGAVQFTDWKAHRLACCRSTPTCHLLPANMAGTGQYGLHLGFQCICCCAGLTAILLVVGIMNLRAMALVTAATTIERFAPTVTAARIIGVVVVAAGLQMMLAAA